MLFLDAPCKVPPQMIIRFHLAHKPGRAQTRHGDLMIRDLFWQKCLTPDDILTIYSGLGPAIINALVCASPVARKQPGVQCLSEGHFNRRRWDQTTNPAISRRPALPPEPQPKILSDPLMEKCQKSSTTRH